MSFLAFSLVWFLQEPASLNVKELYMNNCALCHGENGDGKGLVEFDKPARSFIDGGFSFGNTPKALINTITNGIGGTPMPGFESVLSPLEIEALAEYVRAFSSSVEEQKYDAELRVISKPVIVRGGLPSYHEEDMVHPRAVVLGGTDGLSIEWDMESVQLLAIRRGDFVLRQDWGDRGGALLKPLGELLYTFPKENNKWFLELEVDAEKSSSAIKHILLRKKWLATEISENKAWVEYALLEEISGNKDNRKLAVVRESFNLREKTNLYVRRNINIKPLVQGISLSLDKKYSAEKSFTTWTLNFDYPISPLKD